VISDSMSYGKALGANTYRRPREKSKREQAADLLNAGRRLAREALAEEQRESALDAEYGPRLDVKEAPTEKP